MFMKRVATVAVVAGFTLGLTSAPASAEPLTGGFWNIAGPQACLDFRADVGVYVTGCNFGGYQMWNYDPTVATALRQVATRLCLTVRNDQPVMKPCAAADRAAYWRIDSRLGHIKNNLTNKCLARMANDRVNTAACTGGDSQLWYPNF